MGFKDGPSGGSNRKWVMPVGAAFFTGTNSVGSSSSSSSSAVTATATGAPATNGGTKIIAGSAASSGRIARPNERIDEVRQLQSLLTITRSYIILIILNYLTPFL